MSSGSVRSAVSALRTIGIARDADWRSRRIDDFRRSVDTAAEIGRRRASAPTTTWARMLGISGQLHASSTHSPRVAVGAALRHGRGSRGTRRSGCTSTTGAAVGRRAGAGRPIVRVGFGRRAGERGVRCVARSSVIRARARQRRGVPEVGSAARFATRGARPAEPPPGAGAACAARRPSSATRRRPPATWTSCSNDFCSGRRLRLWGSTSGGLAAPRTRLRCARADPLAAAGTAGSRPPTRYVHGDLCGRRGSSRRSARSPRRRTAGSNRRDGCGLGRGRRGGHSTSIAVRAHRRTPTRRGASLRTRPVASRATTSSRRSTTRPGRRADHSAYIGR
jgi:hypothetical protein